jgi:Uma2 family endonuclease
MKIGSGSQATLLRDSLPPILRAEQIMAMPAEVGHRWTAREVRQLIEENPLVTPRYELVDGELLVTPSPGLPHQVAVLRLAARLMPCLDQQPIGRVLTSPSDIEFEPESITQPDIFVVPIGEFRRAMKEGFPVRELMLAVEVLSPSSGRHDRVRKRPLYQRHVPEYWIVDLDARLVERWKPNDVRPEILTETLSWHPDGATTAFTIDLSAYFESVFDAG